MKQLSFFVWIFDLILSTFIWTLENLTRNFYFSFPPVYISFEALTGLELSRFTRRFFRSLQFFGVPLHPALRRRGLLPGLELVGAVGLDLVAGLALSQVEVRRLPLVGQLSASRDLDEAAGPRELFFTGDAAAGVTALL